MPVALGTLAAVAVVGIASIVFGGDDGPPPTTIDPISETSEPTDTTAPGSDTTTSSTTSTDDELACAEFVAVDARPLSLCDEGPLVVQLQDLLDAIGIPVETTGRFDTSTEVGVTDFQTSVGLEADGVVGDDTWNALVEAAGGVIEEVPTGGATLDGVEQSVIYSCVHYPFQDADGEVLDASVSIFVYGLEDPATGFRTTVEDAVGDGQRVVAVHTWGPLGTIGSVELDPSQDLSDVTVPLADAAPVRVSIVGVPVELPCDPMVVTSDQGTDDVFGVTDVCFAGDTTFVTLNSTFTSGPIARRTLSFEVVDDQGGVSGVFDQPDGSVFFGPPESFREQTARNEVISGTFDDGTGRQFRLVISFYPGGGRNC
ncbi:MAG TPA: peptidoglycan-binding domain-containing protein [Acidimicrobiales bacterium]|nr:peptidoglycan-binding domain-containing protein [Acidimicrobiales bacterium]